MLHTATVVRNNLSSPTNKNEPKWSQNVTTGGERVPVSPQAIFPGKPCWGGENYFPDFTAPCRISLYRGWAGCIITSLVPLNKAWNDLQYSDWQSLQICSQENRNDKQDEYSLLTIKRRNIHIMEMSKISRPCCWFMWKRLGTIIASRNLLAQEKTW